MFQLSESLRYAPVISLRTGGIVANTSDFLINPHNLKIEGWFCSDSVSKQKLILLTKDVRELMPQGLAVNDHNDLSDPEELVRLKDIIGIDFQIIGKTIVTESGKKLGKASDFAIDIDTFMVNKIYVAQPIYKNFTGGQLIIDRNQIVEITDSHIAVKDASEPVGAKKPSFAPASPLS